MSDSEIKVGQVVFRQAENSDLEISLPEICRPEGSADEDTWMKLLSMTEKLEYNSGKVRLICVS